MDETFLPREFVFLGSGSLKIHNPAMTALVRVIKAMANQINPKTAKGRMTEHCSAKATASLPSM